VRVRTDAYAYFVHVETPGERARSSDDSFELEPDQERRITVRVSDGALRPQDVDVRSR
jgi:hypothetical protein